MGRLMNIGFGNVVNTDKVIAVVTPDGAPVKRMVQNARQIGKVVDATQGRRTKSVIFTESDVIVLSALQPDTLVKRFQPLWEGARTSECAHRATEAEDLDDGCTQEARGDLYSEDDA